MNTKTLRGAALIFAMAVAGAPLASRAATAYTAQPVHVNYSTSIEPAIGFGYPWTGTLQLTINPDGIIQGYYRPADNLAYIPVTGGRNGQDVWLDIGQAGRLHVTGSMQNGKIVGGAIDERTNQEYKFSASVS